MFNEVKAQQKWTNLKLEEVHWIKPVHAAKTLAAHNPIDGNGFYRNLTRSIKQQVDPSNVFLYKDLKGAINEVEGIDQLRLIVGSLVDGENRGNLEKILNLIQLNSACKTQDLNGNSVARYEQARLDCGDNFDIMLEQGELLAKLGHVLAPETSLGALAMHMMDIQPEYISKWVPEEVAAFVLFFCRSLGATAIQRGVPLEHAALADAIVDGYLPMLQSSLVHHLQYSYDTLDPMIQSLFEPLPIVYNNFVITLRDQKTNKINHKSKKESVWLLCGVQEGKDIILDLFEDIIKIDTNPLPKSVVTQKQYFNAMEVQEMLQLDQGQVAYLRESVPKGIKDQLVDFDGMVASSRDLSELLPQIAYWFGCAVPLEKVKYPLFANGLSSDSMANTTKDEQNCFLDKIGSIKKRGLDEESDSESEDDDDSDMPKWLKAM